MISDHGGLFIKILRYTKATTSKYSSKTFTLVHRTITFTSQNYDKMCNRNFCGVKSGADSMVEHLQEAATQDIEQKLGNMMKKITWASGWFKR